MTKCVWEILVPTVSQKGKPFRTRYHRVWDARVREISHGLSIISPIKGQWVDPDINEVIQERMIPVRFVATETEAKAIAEMTKKYYDQKVIMLYKISNEIMFI